MWSATYDAYGKATVDGAATVTSNLRFSGQYYDAETNLHYNFKRYYGPEIGRYTTSDPIGLAGGLNPYTYVENSPLNWIDPEGLKMLTYEEIAAIVNKNNHSGMSAEFVICLIWNESNFRYDVDHDGARGLMGMREKQGLAQVNIINKRRKTGVSYTWGEMLDANKNVQAGTEYLDWVVHRPGDVDKNIQNRYGTGPIYPIGKIHDCEKCLKEINSVSKSCKNQKECLENIHK